MVPLKQIQIMAIGYDRCVAMYYASHQSSLGGAGKTDDRKKVSVTKWIVRSTLLRLALVSRYTLSHIDPNEIWQMSAYANLCNLLAIQHSLPSSHSISEQL